MPTIHRAQCDRRSFLRVSGAAAVGSAVGVSILHAPTAAHHNVTLLSSHRISVSRTSLLNADDASVPIQQAIDTAVASDISTVELPPGDPGEYLCRSGIETKGRSLIGADTALTIDGTITTRALITARGALSSPRVPLEYSAEAGDQRVHVPTPLHGTVKPGTVIGLASRVQTTGPSTVGTGQEVFATEIHIVTGISGLYAHIDEPLLWPYPVEADARMFVIDPVANFSIEEITITTTSATDYPTFGLIVREAQNPIVDITLLNAGGGAGILNTIDAAVRVQANTLPRSYDEFGYGLTIAGACARVSAEASGHDCRHVFTTLGESRPTSDGTGFEQWGDPRHITVTGSGTGGTNSFAVYDTHPAGYDITFYNCSADGGGSDAAGFQIRNRNAKLSNCVSTNAGNVALRMAPGAASEVIINGGAYRGAARVGVGLAEGTKIYSATISNNGEAGVIIPNGADSATVSNCVIENNGQFGIQDQSSGNHSDVLIDRNRIPRSGTQTTGVLFPKSNMAITNNYFANFSSVEEAIHQPEPTVHIANNRFDSASEPSTGSLS
ncbi:right-handed parallel beta-helix repeat-containing protein [Hoyosella rhizosphaerae]|uniref:Right handed beta helix domain-containing protein n=1 Tax=Hoyosella rhizosphaerae TaxID=1755582 RepID=A0A916UC45_9ACTN|nr:right-handed parallel beta-helix repeat-containing protein [Hoyosella rhizosphaerae]MBN4925888.1 right-handed parallel beta-helix repeat-containing protein [Hoyosella rhizosphaerae]GGC67166.1 hypothetical protein GCM10011410_19800 [Hoyosella rhizosphaerae]